MLYIYIYFKYRKVHFARTNFFHSPWNLLNSIKGRGENLTFESFISNVCLSYTLALQYRSQIKYYLFRKTFSCSRAIKNFESTDKEEFLSLDRMAFCTHKKLLCCPPYTILLHGSCWSVKMIEVEGRVGFMHLEAKYMPCIACL